MQGESVPHDGLSGSASCSAFVLDQLNKFCINRGMGGKGDMKEVEIRWLQAWYDAPDNLKREAIAILRAADECRAERGRYLESQDRPDADDPDIPQQAPG